VEVAEVRKRYIRMHRSKRKKGGKKNRTPRDRPKEIYLWTPPLPPPWADWALARKASEGGKLGRGNIDVHMYAVIDQ